MALCVAEIEFFAQLGWRYCLVSLSGWSFSDGVSGGFPEKLSNRLKTAWRLPPGPNSLSQSRMNVAARELLEALTDVPVTVGNAP
jgi:hypothetical protein